MPAATNMLIKGAGMTATLVASGQVSAGSTDLSSVGAQVGDRLVVVYPSGANPTSGVSLNGGWGPHSWFTNSAHTTTATGGASVYTLTSTTVNFASASAYMVWRGATDAGAQANSLNDSPAGGIYTWAWTGSTDIARMCVMMQLGTTDPTMPTGWSKVFYQIGSYAICIAYDAAPFGSAGNVTGYPSGTPVNCVWLKVVR